MECLGVCRPPVVTLAGGRLCGHWWLELCELRGAQARVREAGLPGGTWPAGDTRQCSFTAVAGQQFHIHLDSRPVSNAPALMFLQSRPWGGGPWEVWPLGAVQWWISGRPPAYS